MLILGSGMGASDFELLGSYGDEQEDLFYNAALLLSARGKIEASATLAQFNWQLVNSSNRLGDDFLVLLANLPIEQYEYIRKNSNDKDFKNNLSEAVTVLNEVIFDSYIRFTICELEPKKAQPAWRKNLANYITSLNSNQALFTYSNNPKIVHEKLNFRSKTEVKLYNELISRGLLVLPLPVAVLGHRNLYKEPDFIVVKSGKVGILEIHGEIWHPPERADQEHERKRQFNRLGVTIYEIFGAERCWNETSKVVDEFIAFFE